MSATGPCVYEVVENTNEEVYWPLGLYLDEAEALAELDSPTPPYSDDKPESVCIEVRARPLGFHPHAYDTIAKRIWVKVYTEDSEFWQPEDIQRFRRPA